MKISDDDLKAYRERKLTMDIPRPIVTGHTEITKEKRKEAVENLKKWIKENTDKKNN